MSILYYLTSFQNNFSLFLHAKFIFDFFLIILYKYHNVRKRNTILRITFILSLAEFYLKLSQHVTSGLHPITSRTV